MTSLYVHIPFCISKCLFCSFVVSIGQAHRVDEYIDALARESAAHKGARIGTVYFGGGTPTFLDERQLRKLTDAIRKNFDVEDSAEWTIEANPENLNLSKARFLRELGFNRLSIGVQSFDERYLKFLGRNHDRDTALKSYADARNAGFTNINVDLMFGFPGQSVQDLASDIHAIAQLQSEHVSLYNLTIEENSRFHAKQIKLDDQDHLAAEYVLICESLEGMGLRQYEVSNFSRPQYESRHNTNYWNGSSYIGLGVGAHAFLKNRRSWNVAKLQEYFTRIGAGGEAVEGFEDLSRETLLMERVLFGLRKNEGIVLEDIETSLGLRLDHERIRRMEEFIADGFLVREHGRIKTSMKGRLVLDELSSRLI